MRTFCMVVLISCFLSACAGSGVKQSKQTHQALQNAVAGLKDLKSDKPILAYNKLKLAQSQAPEEPQVLLAWAYYLQHEKQYVGANAVYLRAIAKDRTRSDSYNSYGAFLCQRGSLKQAKEQFLLAHLHQTHRDKGLAYQNIAMCDYNHQHFGSAKTYFQMAISENPRLRDSYFYLAKLANDDGQKDLAQSYIHKYQRYVSKEIA